MSSQPAITEADKEKLRHWSRHGPYQATSSNQSQPKLELDLNDYPIRCDHCGHEWRYTGRLDHPICPQCKSRTTPEWLKRLKQDPHGLTIEQCNAIRCAAEDGRSYRYIGELFSFISGREPAWRHATGHCSHGRGDYPPQDSGNDQGGNGKCVTKSQCSTMRRLREQGLTTYDIADELPFDRRTIGRHVRGDCSHHRR